MGTVLECIADRPVHELNSLLSISKIVDSVRLKFRLYVFWVPANKFFERVSKIWVASQKCSNLTYSRSSVTRQVTPYS